MATKKKTISITDRDKLLDDPRVHPDARRKFRAVLQDVRGHGLPLVVWEVYRSKEQQRMYYAQGRTDAMLLARGFTAEEIQKARKRGFTADKPVITKLVNPQYHGLGLAMDCCWLVEGKYTWSVPTDWWETYGRAAKAHGLEWGGDWKMRDLPHIQLTVTTAKAREDKGD